jgi:hypothetical protein
MIALAERHDIVRFERIVNAATGSSGFAAAACAKPAEGKTNSKTRSAAGKIESALWKMATDDFMPRVSREIFHAPLLM